MSQAMIQQLQQFKVIPVIQINKVELEEQSAQSEIIEIEQFGAVHKIGVVEIPTFYVDFRAMQKGDRVTVEIEGIGSLSNYVEIS